jgi:hypothetical protein
MSANPSPIKASGAQSGENLNARVLTVPEIARELRCSKAHVHNIILGKVPGVTPLPSLSMGRRRVVRRTSFDAWMEANEHPL